MKTNISVILPVHELNEETKVLFAKAVASVAQQEVQPDELVIVVPVNSDVAEFVREQKFEGITKVLVVFNEGATDFASQVNAGVLAATSEWVSILEVDDEFTTIWFKNAVKYRETYKEVGMFLPIVVDTDKEGTFIGFTNEAVWANSFSDVLGILDLNALLDFQSFNTDGFVMRKDLFLENGGFKPSIKLTFLYEFLLRMAFKEVKIMVIPKFGYKHMNFRDGSLFAGYKTGIDPIEAKWWLAQAKKEYYFQTDRKITYEEIQG